MTKPNDCAFPSIEVGDGLTKREYFAAMAMQGILANSAWQEEFKVNDWGIDGKRIADNAAQCADALINELNKEEK